MTASRPSRRQFLESTGAVFVGGALAGCAASRPPGDARTDAGGARGASGGGAAASSASAGSDPRAEDESRRRERVVVSTWAFGRHANRTAWDRLTAGASHPIDACEAGVRVTEADPSVSSVGLGGLPNADGVVQLDSAIMRGDTLACGGVAGLTDTLHAVSVARAVMERTPHVLLVGEGARAFARSAGFPAHELLTDRARDAWERWKTGGGRPDPHEDHDTIGQIVKDGRRFGTAVTTSGLAWKLPGRAGDSPIVGAGGYCDDAAGAAVSTGVGEEVLRVCGTFLVVERLRAGDPPREACLVALRRVADAIAGRREGIQVAFLAVDRAGRVGAAALRPGFEYAVTDDRGTAVVEVEPLS